MPNRNVLSLIGLFIYAYTFAQQDTVITSKLGDKYIAQVSDKASSIEKKLNKKSQKIIKAFQQEEDRLRGKLGRKDSATATILENGKEQYAQLQSKLDKAGKLQQYIPSLDTLSSSLAFLKEHSTLIARLKDGPGKLDAAIANVKGLESSLRQAEEIKRLLKERRQLLKDQLSKLGMTRELAKLNKQAYYYSAQVTEYKQLLKDHRKAEKKALELLSKTQLFKDFMHRNSLLASLFRLPGDPNDPSSQVNLSGLQTRAQVNSLVQQQLSAGGPNAQAQFSQNMQQAQGQLNEVKNKLAKYSGGDNELDMPEGFKPNTQKTKSFLQRIELGANIQSQRSNGFFPVTSDLALTAGYKLNDKSVIGVGAGYKMGWGRNIQHIKVTHEGMSLRSFIDVKLKGSFWLTGGYEMHYRSSFKNIEELKDRSGWQESGLIGMSKVIDMRSKLLKKTKVQLLWDFLSYRQVPKPAAVLFRIGYNF
ncbi:MAG: hypothetical protein DI535_04190 [Citrobacter freundii]|nr:MAG: hypothetical protein DI535_04190 [Citrobacter freundii]